MKERWTGVQLHGVDRMKLTKITLPIVISAGMVSALALTAAHAQQPGGALPPVEVTAQKAKAKSAKQKQAPAPAATQVAEPIVEPIEPVVDVAPSFTGREADFTTPAPVRTVTPQEIQQIGANRADDLLRTVPGVFTQSTVGSPGVSVNIRGMQDFGRVGVSVDGARQNFQVSGHGANGTAYVDPLLVRSIDIQKGTVATEGGAGVLGGTVNFRTVELQDILTGGKNYGAEVSTTFGTNGYNWSTMAATGFQTDRVSVFGAFSFRDSGDYKDGRGNTVFNTGQELVSGLGKLGFRLDDAQTWNLGINSYNNEYGSTFSDNKVEVLTVTSKYRFNPSWNPLVDVRFNSFYTKTKLDESYFGFIVGEQITYNNDGIGGDLTNTSRFHAGGIDFTAKYGVEGFYDWVKTKDVGPDQSYPGMTPDGERGIASAFTEVKGTVGRFDLIGATRVDHYSLTGSGVINSMPVFGIPPLPVGPYEVDKSETAVSPKATLAFRPTDWMQLYGSYGLGFRPPAITESLMSGRHPGGVPVRFFPNPFLDPERTRGWEIGLNAAYDGLFRPRDNVRMKANYFDNDVEDYIASIFGMCMPVSPPGAPNPCFAYSNIAGTTRVKGFEFEVGYDARFAFVNLGYAHVTNDLPGGAGLGVLPYQPEDIWTLTAGLRFANERIVIGGRIRDVSGSEYLDSSTIVPISGYQLYDAFASFKVNDNLEFNFNAENLTNEYYIPAMTTDEMRGPGMTVKFGMTARL
jgi:hemoglobin/transferrin/lactoferrin receptor protein